MSGQHRIGIQGLAAGGAIGLLLADHVWLVLVLGVALGVAGTLAAQKLGRLTRWLDRSISPLTMRQWKGLRRRVNTLRPDDEIPY